MTIYDTNSKLENKCEKCVWKFIYARKWRKALTAPILMELAFKYDILLDTCCRGFYQNSKINVENMAKINLRP